MKEKQLHHHQVNFENSGRHNIEVFLEHIDSPANLGSIFRNADAFGVQTLWIMATNEIDLESTRFKRTSRSTWKSLNVRFYDDPQSVLSNFTGTKIGLEITSNSENLTQLNLTKSDQVLLVLGNERLGISDEILQQLDQICHIEMIGNNSSLNVSQTLGIALYEIRR